MNSSFATSLEQLWRSATFPLWLTLAAGGFFVLILLLSVARAEKSAANGALTAITLLAIGVAVAVTLRGLGPGGGAVTADTSPATQLNVALPALSCIDDLAGDSVGSACEKVLFGSAESAAAAVSYAASRVSRLVAYGNAAVASQNMTAELDALRRSVQRDRYGLFAYVLLVRDHCLPSDCAVFRSLTTSDQIVSNMEERIYDQMIAHYAPSWNSPSMSNAAPMANATPMANAAPAGPPPATVAALPSLPAGATGKPTNADFPSAASIPPVNIMTPEPTIPAPRAPASAANAQASAPRPAAPAAAKKPAAPKTRPVQLAPAAPTADN